MKVKIITTMNEITLQLNQEKAPETVKNFLEYVQSDFYNGTIFHRVIKGFMIQGGGLDKNMQTKKTNAPIENEADNGLSNKYGTIAMARTSDPHSATAQFFINTSDNLFLDFKAKNPNDWGYCVFGEVVDGVKAVNNIEKVDTSTSNGHQDVPKEIIEIEKIVLLEDEK